MNSLSCLIESGDIVGADANVVINLLETRCFEANLNALQNKMVIPSQIDREILREQYRRPNNATNLEQYIATKK